MSHIDDLESMLFGLKEVVKDSDAVAVKNEIDQKIRTLGTGESIDV